MLPDFDQNGQLPPGVYHMSFEDVVKRFGGSRSLKRSALTKSLKEFINFIKHHAISVYLDGSYVTNKLAPNDVDLLVVLPEEFPPNTKAETRLLSFVIRRNSNHLHIFSYHVGKQDGEINQLLNWFTTDRDGRLKGIINLEFQK